MGWYKKNGDGAETNGKLTTRFFGIAERHPSTKCGTDCTVFEENFEDELKRGISSDPSLYEQLVEDAITTYALKPKSNKEIIARYIANKIEVPDFVKDILYKIEKNFDNFLYFHSYRSIKR